MVESIKAFLTFAVILALVWFAIIFTKGTNPFMVSIVVAVVTLMSAIIELSIGTYKNKKKHKE